MNHLLIIGVGGFARECYWHAQGSIGYGEEWDIKGFLDGDVNLALEEYAKLEKPVLGDVFTYDIQPDDVFIGAIGESTLRKKLVAPILQHGGQFINLIHKTAFIQGNVTMGIGNIICPVANIGDHAKVGDFVILNRGAGIAHDCVVGSYSSFMGNASICGFGTAGENTYWATNAVGLPYCKVGDNVSVGVGSVVFKRVRSGLKVFGNPAVPYDRNDDD